MQMRALRLHDRAVLAGSRIFMGSALGRLFLAVYAALLHLFILVRCCKEFQPHSTVLSLHTHIAAIQQGSNIRGLQVLDTTCLLCYVGTSDQCIHFLNVSQVLLYFAMTPTTRVEIVDASQLAALQAVGAAAASTPS
jgi:hypothetical protein